MFLQNSLVFSSPPKSPFYGALHPYLYYLYPSPRRFLGFLFTHLDAYNGFTKQTNKNKLHRNCPDGNTHSFIFPAYLHCKIDFDHRSQINKDFLHQILPCIQDFAALKCSIFCSHSIHEINLNRWSIPNLHLSRWNMHPFNQFHRFQKFISPCLLNQQNFFSS